MADIKNKIYEAGILRAGEKIVLTASACVLLEYYTGKTFSYRMVDLQTLKAKHLFSRKNPITDGNYKKAIEKMLAVAVHTDDIAEIHANERAARLLTYIFTDILPLHGMT
ncbi:MAG: hypothetical protein RR559_11285, partial [Bacteroides sp.]